MSKLKFILEYMMYINSIKKYGHSKYSDEYIYDRFIENTKAGKIPINEGLIYSQPIDLTIKILKRRFDYLDIKKYEDGDISIEGIKGDLSKYIPIINNLGYFISSAFIGDESIDIKSVELSKIKCDSIFIEPKYDFEVVDIPRILYHVSPLKLRGKIIKNGLVPKSGSKLSYHPDRIYLTDSYEICRNFGDYLSNNQTESDYYDIGYCIYIVKGSGIDKLYSDINLRDGGYYTLNNISKEYIELFKCVKKK